MTTRQKRNSIILWMAFLVVLYFTAFTHLNAATAPQSAKAAIEAASHSGQYLFLVFYDTQNEVVNGMVNQVQEFNRTSSKKGILYKALVTNQADAEVAAKYGIDVKAGLPILLVVAPNGVVTGGYQQSMTMDQLTKSTSAPDLVLEILKPLQERKIALVKLQNAGTKFNQESSDAVSEFAADPRLKPFVAIINADPSKKDSKEFMKQCKLPDKITEATVVFLIPPATVAKVLSGKITKANLLSALSACSSGGSGCCPKP
ncbi:MAG: hypothetical protein V2A69_12980 [Pseudomonadota bacterium]